MFKRNRSINFYGEAARDLTANWLFFTFYVYVAVTLQVQKVLGWFPPTPSMLYQKGSCQRLGVMALYQTAKMIELTFVACVYHTLW